MIVAGIISVSDWKTIKAELISWNGFELNYSQFGIATVFANGCSHILTRPPMVTCYRIWCGRDEPWWDESLDFIYATLFRLLRKSEESLGKMIALPNDLIREVKAARATKHAGEGI